MRIDTREHTLLKNILRRESSGNGSRVASLHGDPEPLNEERVCSWVPGESGQTRTYISAEVCRGRTPSPKCLDSNR